MDLRFTFPVQPFRFRPVRFILLAILLLALLIWRLFPPPDDGSLSEIKQRGRLRVGLDASFPPFESIDKNGQI